MAQFEQVSFRHGAPMGRREDGYTETRVKRFARASSRFLAAVKLDIPVPALKSGLPGWVNRYCHYADNPAMLTLHGIGRADFLEWARWSGVAMGQNPADYQWGAA